MKSTSFSNKFEETMEATPTRKGQKYHVRGGAAARFAAFSVLVLASASLWTQEVSATPTGVKPKRFGENCDPKADECSAYNRSLTCSSEGKCVCVPNRIWNGAKCQNRGYGSWCGETTDCYLDAEHAPPDYVKDSGLVCDRHKVCRCKNARPYWNGSGCSTSPCYSDEDCSKGHICFEFGRTCIKKADKRAAEESINWIAANIESLLKLHGVNDTASDTLSSRTPSFGTNASSNARASRRDFDLYSIYFIMGFIVLLLVVIIATRVFSRRQNQGPITVNSASSGGSMISHRNFIAETRLMNGGESDSAVFIRELLDECQRQFVDDRPTNAVAKPSNNRNVRPELPSYDEATAPPTYDNAVHTERGAAASSGHKHGKHRGTPK